MKKLTAITTALCAVTFTAVFSGATAYADTTGGLDYYPSPAEFQREAAFSNVDEYAVGADKYAFLDGNVIYEYAGGVLSQLNADGAKTMTSLFYKEGTILCYANSGGAFEYLTDEPAEPEEVKDSITINNYHYFKNTEGWYVLNQNEPLSPAEPLTDFSALKESGGKVYGLKQNDNSLYCLYSFNGAEAEKIKLLYLDYSITGKILIGDSKETLQTFSAECPSFVYLKEGSLMTELSIDETDGEYFKTGATLTAGKEITAKTALLLANTGKDGKISIVMTTDGNKSACYIMHSDGTGAIERQPVKQKTLGATVTVDDGFIYTAPFVCANTRLFDGETQVKIKSGDALKVTGEITKDDNPELARSFYKVEFTDEDGKTHTGYVPTGYVSPFAFIEPPPTVTPDPDYSEENVIKTVVLVILVVMLVLAAGGYIVYALWAGKFKKKDKNDKNR